MSKELSAPVLCGQASFLAYACQVENEILYIMSSQADIEEFYCTPDMALERWGLPADFTFPPGYWVPSERSDEPDDLVDIGTYRIEGDWLAIVAARPIPSECGGGNEPRPMWFERLTPRS
jgi:hypothetical protein